MPGNRIQYGGAVINQREMTAIINVITKSNGRNWTIGKEGENFENELAHHTKKKYVVLANSGSSALLLAMLSLRLPKGSRVVIPATCFPTAISAIVYAGMVPVLVDSKLDTFCIDEASLEKALTSIHGIRAVIAVNIAGNIPNLDRIIALAKKYGLKIILDNCDGFGGNYRGKPVEQFGDIAGTSFHAAHIISMGEGGAIFTNDKNIATLARMYRDWGREGADDSRTALSGLPADYPKRYAYPVLGFNLKPMELQAAQGRIQLKKMRGFKREREKNFMMLYQTFKKYPNFFGVMRREENADPCWFSFPLWVKGFERKKFLKFLDGKNIEWRPIFSGNIARHPIGKRYALHNVVPLSHAETILKNGLFLPVSPRNPRQAYAYLCRCIDEFINKKLYK